MIEIRTYIAGNIYPHFDMPASVQQGPCNASGRMSIGIELPQDVNPKPDFDLIRDESFFAFQNLNKQPPWIEATVEGRFDPVFIWRNNHRVKIGEGVGFGPQNNVDARVVLHRVSDVISRIPAPRIY
jgi:hypothetical protein